MIGGFLFPLFPYTVSTVMQSFLKSGKLGESSGKSSASSSKPTEKKSKPVPWVEK